MNKLYNISKLNIIIYIGWLYEGFINQLLEPINHEITNIVNKRNKKKKEKTEKTW